MYTVVDMHSPTIHLLLGGILLGSNGLSAAFAAFESLQALLQEENHNIDIITGSDFNGLTTFANLPYSNCFRDGGEDFDIAILGAPFDTVCMLFPHYCFSGRFGRMFKFTACFELCGSSTSWGVERMRSPINDRVMILCLILWPCSALLKFFSICSLLTIPIFDTPSCYGEIRARICDMSTLKAASTRRIGAKRAESAQYRSL